MLIFRVLIAVLEKMPKPDRLMFGAFAWTIMNDVPRFERGNLEYHLLQIGKHPECNANAVDWFERCFGTDGEQFIFQLLTFAFEAYGDTGETLDSMSIVPNLKVIAKTIKEYEARTATCGYPDELSRRVGKHIRAVLKVSRKDKKLTDCNLFMAFEDLLERARPL